MEIKVDRFASATARIKIPNPVRVEHHPFPKVGDVVVVEALTENPAYPFVEVANGRKFTVKQGDIIAGVIGSRQALRGFVGYAPMKVNPNDELFLLNMGGVIGRFIDGAIDLGMPVKVRVLGVAMNGDQPHNIADDSIEATPFLLGSKPIVLVVGTCMNTGKTVAATKLIEELSEEGIKVGAVKLSGVAALKDTVKMKEAGAVRVLSFIDAGYPSTIDAKDMTAVVKGILNRINQEEIDVIVAELGDGILGHYRVEEVLGDPSIMDHVAAVIVGAGDIVGAYGAKELLSKLGITPLAFCGPATDNVSGSEYIEERLGVRAINVMKNPQGLCNLVMEAIRSVKVEK